MGSHEARIGSPPPFCVTFQVARDERDLVYHDVPNRGSGAAYPDPPSRGLLLRDDREAIAATVEEDDRYMVCARHVSSAKLDRQKAVVGFSGANG